MHRPGAYSGILAKVEGVAPRLEALRLASTDERGTGKKVNYFTPLDSLQQFTGLKRLSIPQGAFVNATGLDVPSARTFDALPPILEYPCVSDPAPAVVNWLSNILYDGDKVRNLKTVMLDFGKHPDKRCLDYLETAGKAGKCFFEAGVDVRYDNAHPRCWDSEENVD
jgi:hypothetical protein